MAATLESALQMHRQGQLAEAGAMYQQILVQDPKNMDALRLISVLHEQKGDVQSATDFARQMVALKPKQVAYYLHLANLLLTASQVDEAISWLEKAVKIDRRNMDVHLLLGDACQQDRNYIGALQHYQRALQLDRSVPDVYNNMGNTQLALGNQTEAIEQYKKAISLKPDYVEAHFNLGNAQRQFGNLPEAIGSYQKAIELDPYFYRAHGMLGLVAKNMNNYDHAEAFYRQCLAIQPDDGSTLSNLAIVLAEQDRIDEAMEIYQQLVQKHPDHPDILSDFALTIIDKGYFDRAMVMFEALAQQNPHNPNQRINHALALPAVYHSAEDLQHWRKRFEQGLDTLIEHPLNPIHPHKVGAFSGGSFYLSYQGENDKELQCKKSQLYQKLLPVPPEALVNAVRKPNVKPRIGFISGHLSPKHTVGKLMYGILAKLSREKFDIHIFSTPTKHAFSANVRIHPDDQINLLPYPSLMQSWEQIKAANLDIIFFPDIGMDPFCYLLANYRMAPIQCVTWGHPVTTGIPNIDYFISSKLIEPENAQAQYTEKLVLLDSLPTYYYKPKLSYLTNLYSEFGLNEADHIYLCPQSLYKFHPDFDPIVAEILRQDPKGRLVIVDQGHVPLKAKLIERFKKTMSAELIERIQFIPGCGREKFLQLLTCATVMLDPIHFGGGNTTYEALSLGIPIVTWPSQYMRGRATAACYQKMGLPELITQSAADYIALAKKLGTDPEARAQAHAQILSQNKVLYEDAQVIEELEAFFLNALAHHQGDLSHG